MRKTIKVLAVLIAAVLCCSLMGCGKKKKKTAVLETAENGLPRVVKTGSGLRYHSSDENFAAFLNDYYSRHVRDNSDKSIGNVQLGLGWMFQKEWESKYLSWFDSTASGINGYDALYNMASGLDAVYVSDYGCVSVKTHMPYAAGNQAGGVAAHGWGFVYGLQTGNYSADFTDGAEGWRVNGALNAGTFSDGFWNYAFQGEQDQALVYEINGLGESVQYAPMVEIALQLRDNSPLGAYDSAVEDIVLSFKMAGQSEWTSMSYARDAIFNPPIRGNDMLRTWFPVYLHPAWTGTLDGLRIELVPKAGQKLHIASALNYVRLETDTRFTNTNTWYIAGMEEYLSFTGDKDMLARNLTDLRKAMMFQLYALGGADGLLKTDYIRGKTTTLVEKNKFGMQGNSWYDVLPTGTVNMQANVCFYQSLLSMALIEEYAAAAGIDAGDAYVRAPHPYAADAQDIRWTHTPASLRAIAAARKVDMQKNVSDGGLWNEQTGRFAWAIYDEGSYGGEQGAPMDYGHTEINLMAVLYDIASPQQKQSILSWIDGTRTVQGDNSQGDDIYFYRFAPRISTKNNVGDSISVWKLGKFKEDIQNGGASMHITFYDVLSRHAVLGADNSFARLKEIQAWYEEVQAAEGKGDSFYRAYYADKMVEGGNVYKMQGGGTAGPIGLDAEFYESALLYATVPYAYLGLDASFGGLHIAPDLPADLDWLAMENLMFRNVRYDVYVSHDRTVISGVRGKTDASVQIRMRAKEGQKAYVNYKPVDAAVTDGYITVTVPLAQCTVDIR